MKRILFMGTPDYATAILKTLLQQTDMEVVALITQADKPVGRKQIMTPPHIKQFVLSEAIDLPIYQPATLRSDEALQFIKEKQPDFIVVAAYGQILPKAVLEIVPCINLHASILPKYRGASPIQSAIADREEVSGVTAMKMDVGLDTGDILAYSMVKINGMNSIELFDKLSDLAAQLTPKVIRNYEKIQAIKQIDALSSYSPKIKKEDGLVNFEDAEALEAKYRAFIAWPGLFLESGLKLKSLKLHRHDGVFQAGEILELNKESAIIGCKRGSLEIFRVQAPSKKEVDILSYLRGKRLDRGDLLL